MQENYQVARDLRDESGRRIIDMTSPPPESANHVSFEQLQRRKSRSERELDDREFEKKQRERREAREREWAQERAATPAAMRELFLPALAAVNDADVALEKARARCEQFDRLELSGIKIADRFGYDNAHNFRKLDTPTRESLAAERRETEARQLAARGALEKLRSKIQATPPTEPDQAYARFIGVKATTLKPDQRVVKLINEDGVVAFDLMNGDKVIAFEVK